MGIAVPAYQKSDSVTHAGVGFRSSVITYRNDGVRIISVRRSRIEEVEIYEGRRI